MAQVYDIFVASLRCFAGERRIFKSLSVFLSVRRPGRLYSALLCAVPAPGPSAVSVRQILARPVPRRPRWAALPPPRLESG